MTLTDSMVPRGTPKGIYKHYKGGLYRVLQEAMHTETKQWFVIYQNIEHGSFYARPTDMFCEHVKTENGEVQRFKYLRGDV